MHALFYHIGHIHAKVRGEPIFDLADFARDRKIPASLEPPRRDRREQLRARADSATKPTRSMQPRHATITMARGVVELGANPAQPLAGDAVQFVSVLLTSRTLERPQRQRRMRDYADRLIVEPQISGVVCLEAARVVSWDFDDG
jgi:hypothetical protein